MARLDRLKEEIGWLKVGFAVCVALDTSLTVWLAQNYATAKPVLVVMGCVGAAALSWIVAYAIRRVYRGLSELEVL